MRLPCALLALVASLVLAACADTPAEPASGKVSVRGIYIQPMYQGQAMLVDHEAIPGRMPAMRMAFRLYTPALLDSVTEGARVRLTLDRASLTVVGIRTLSFETDLELGSDGGRGGITLPPPPEDR